MARDSSRARLECDLPRVPEVSEGRGSRRNRDKGGREEIVSRLAASHMPRAMTMRVTFGMKEALQSARSFVLDS